ncbi:hypothetical protein ACFLS4_03140 [Bacteroidota bacterium]
MKRIFDLRFIESKQFFYFILFLNIILLCFTYFYPSMDGASHLYNSNVLGHILLGNNTLREFYSITTIPIPNWISHFILGLFVVLFPAWIAEKILIILYVAGMAISFRYLLKQLNRDNSFLSILIFPFIYSLLFHLGFYNFSISFIFFFFTLGYYLKNYINFSLRNYFFLFLFISLTFFSNILIYGFLGLVLALVIFYFTYEYYKTTKDYYSTLKYGVKKILFLFMVSTPSLICMFLFISNVTFLPSEQAYSTKELIKWINDARPFIVYDYVSEEIITEQYLHVLLILIVITFLKSEKKMSNFNLKKADILLVPIIITLALYFITPNSSGAGMMSYRYCLIFYMFGLLWICSRSIQNNFNRVLVLFIIFLHIGLLFKHLNGPIRKLDKDAQSIYQSSKYINDNNIVLPIDLSDNWIEPHFSNYLGVDKPLIILENYEANVGWFPIKWNSKNFPNVLLGDKNSINGITWKSNTESKKVRQIDNIILYGNTDKINNKEWLDLKELISMDFRLIYKSDDNFVLLYERMHNLKNKR